MKGLTYIVAISALFAGVATAQPPERGPNMDRMAILLDLNEYQKTEVQRIFDEQRTAARAAREAARASGVRPTREERDAQRQQMADNTRTQLETVLTPQQIAKLDALAEMREDRGHRGEGRRGDWRDERGTEPQE